MSQSNDNKDSSDPVSYTCTCSCSPASKTGETGLILLFYRYYSQPPVLNNLSLDQTPQSLASFHDTLTTSLSLGGKIRIAKEGFNITVGGTTSNINNYITHLLTHWSFTNLNLSTPELQNAFFKPSPGCACAFPGPTKINVKNEITPLGVTNYSPKDWGCVKSLEPWEWHDRFSQTEEEEDTIVGEENENGNVKPKRKTRVLIDVRNHYESRIGYFIDPVTGNEAIRPGIRRFSQWPGFAARFFGSDVGSSSRDEDPSSQSSLEIEGENLKQSEKQEIFTYCTGGIRCEKGVRWMQENTPDAVSANSTVYTLRGGISGYLMWMESEIVAGRKTPSESLFKGRNYVFDGRGSVGLPEATQKVAICHGCGREEDRLGKCRIDGCHLVLVVCEECEKMDGGVKCCLSCEENERKGICECEKARERELWGGEQQVKIGHGRKKVKQRTGAPESLHKQSLSSTTVNSTDINVKIKVI